MMTTEQAPPLAPVYEKQIDRDTLSKLFIELGSHARLVSVNEKGGPTQYAGDDYLDLATVQSRLLSGATYAVQLRYDYDGQAWCDTLLRAHDGWKLLRMRQG